MPTHAKVCTAAMPRYLRPPVDLCLLMCVWLCSLHAGAARSSGPGSPWTKLHKFVLRALDKQKKAPAGSREPSAAAAAAGATSSSSAATTSSSSSGSKKGQAAEQAAGQQPPPGVRQCWGCGMRPGADESLQKCSGCRQALYCSRACQTAAWKGHKADCKKWQEARAHGGSKK